MREDERMENFPYNSDEEIWHSMINLEPFCCRVQNLEDPEMECQLCKPRPPIAKAAEKPLKLKALVDTGVTRSFISKELIKEVESADGCVELELETAVGQSEGTPGQPDTGAVKLKVGPRTLKDLKISIKSRE